MTRPPATPPDTDAAKSAADPRPALAADAPAAPTSASFRLLPGGVADDADDADDAVGLPPLHSIPFSPGDGRDGGDGEDDDARRESGWSRFLPVLPGLVAGVALVIGFGVFVQRIRDDRQRAEAARIEVEVRESLQRVGRLLRGRRPDEALAETDKALESLSLRRRLGRAPNNGADAELNAALGVLRGRALLVRAGRAGSGQEAPGAEKREDIDAAAAEFCRAITCAQASGRAALWSTAAWYGLARAQVRRREWDAAAESLNRLLSLNRDYGAGYALRARVRHALGDDQGAREDARRALSLGENPPPRHWRRL